VFYAPHRWPEHANRESLVLQSASLLSIQRQGAETYAKKERLLKEEEHILPHD
jgi:hypothetical protein